MIWQICISVSTFLVVVNCKMEPFVVGGKVTNISRYPHSIYLRMDCDTEFICGGSILNQQVILTAAHCLEDCTIEQLQRGAIVKYGSEHISNMGVTRMKNFVMHEDYFPFFLQNDIALVTTARPIKLGLVKRVVLMKSPPRNVKLAYIAGWGVMNKEEDVSKVLLETSQELHTLKMCKDYMGHMPTGTLCAGPIRGPGVPNQGDSGSALVVNKYIQIGLVSYKLDHLSLVVYTNVSDFIDWIKTNAVKVVCQKVNKVS